MLIQEILLFTVNYYFGSSMLYSPPTPHSQVTVTVNKAKLIFHIQMTRKDYFNGHWDLIINYQYSSTSQSKMNHQCSVIYAYSSF